jgi:hypothetical protein
LSFSATSPEEEFQIPKFGKLNSYEQKMYKLAKALSKLKAKLNKHNKGQATEKSILQLKVALKNPNNILNDTFEATDDDNIDLPGQDDRLVNRKNRKEKLPFI